MIVWIDFDETALTIKGISVCSDVIIAFLRRKKSTNFHLYACYTPEVIP